MIDRMEVHKIFPSIKNKILISLLCYLGFLLFSFRSVLESTWYMCLLKSQCNGTKRKFRSIWDRNKHLGITVKYFHVTFLVSFSINPSFLVSIHLTLMIRLKTRHFRKRSVSSSSGHTWVTGTLNLSYHNKPTQWLPFKHSPVYGPRTQHDPFECKTNISSEGLFFLEGKGQQIVSDFSMKRNSSCTKYIIGFIKGRKDK